MTKLERVYKIVSQIPKGQVTTYGLIAKISGIKSPRAIGTMLHKNIDPDLVPCHRVVNRDGKTADHYAFGGAYVQQERLEKEGVGFVGDRVDLKKYLWQA